MTRRDEAALNTRNPCVSEIDDMKRRATGTFEVKLTPQPADDYFDATTLSRLTLDKEFKGDLEGTSKGQMLSAMTSIRNSAGYVAIERVAGTLQGRKGGFILQHSGTMNRGAASLVVSIVPDSGTGALEGISGTMSIDLSGGKHAYTIDYTLGN